MNDERKLSIISKCVLVVTLLTACWSIFVVNGLGVVPTRYFRTYLIILVLVMLALVVMTLLPSVISKKAQTIISAVLAVLLIISNIAFPAYKSKFARFFAEIPDTTELNYHVFVLKDSDIEKVNDLNGRNLAVQSALDNENQVLAIEDIKGQMNNQYSFQQSEYDDIFAAVEALYNHQVDALLLSEEYADIVQDIEDYENFEEDTRIICTVTQEIINEHSVYVDPMEDITKHPFAVLVGGNDSWNLKNVSKTVKAGRTDVNLLMLVDPVNHKILMITIPRDSYVALGGNTRKMDKITHATVYSVDTWVKSAEWLLDLEIPYYVRVNFATVVRIVDALGGLDIDNPETFKTITHPIYVDGNKVHMNATFQAGPLHLDGPHTLLYVRERKNLTNGDLGRTQHQAIILKALINKVTSPAIITKADSVLSAVEGAFATNFPMDYLFDLIKYQLDDLKATWSFESYNLSGKGFTGKSYAMGSQVYMVQLSDEKIDIAKNMIREFMKID